MGTSSNVIGATQPAWDLRELMNSLRQASDLDLLRLQSTIDHLLQNPTRILAVRQRLHVGQKVHCWNLRDNRMQQGRITKFKSDQLLILTENPPQYWWISYAAIQLDPRQAPLPEPPRPLERADFALGDTVSFEGRDLFQRLGSIVRLNQKTATVSCDGHKWRASFALRSVTSLMSDVLAYCQHGFRGRLRYIIRRLMAGRYGLQPPIWRCPGPRRSRTFRRTPRLATARNEDPSTTSPSFTPMAQRPGSHAPIGFCRK